MRRVLVVLVVLVAATYCGWVATTTPFTLGSDLAVSVGIAAMAVAAGWARRRQPSGVVPLPPGDPPAITPWLALVVAVAAVELVTYGAGATDRAAFPTLSALGDIAEGSTAAKAALVAGWLALGWGLLGR